VGADKGSPKIIKCCHNQPPGSCVICEEVGLMKQTARGADSRHCQPGATGKGVLLESN